MTDLLFHATSRSTVIKLDNGLIMRWSTKDDADNIATLVGDAFRWFVCENTEQGTVPPPNEMLMAGVHRLLSGKNAVMTENDYAVVEDTHHEPRKNPIVACMALHRVRAYYGCVDLIIGKPELIATHINYRNRGLARRLIHEMVHPESQARGDDMQFIPGIPHFYRSFGYEYGLTSFPVSKIPDVQQIPKLSDAKQEPFILRPATASDITYLISNSTKEKVHPFTQVGLQHGPEYWYWTVRDAPSVAKTKYDCDRVTSVVVNAMTGEDVGFVVTSHVVELALELFWLEESVELEVALYSILRQLATIHQEKLGKWRAKTPRIEDTQDSGFNAFHFVLQLHPSHPAIGLLSSILAPQEDEPGYRMYVRIHSYPHFIRAVSRELERRLAQSSMAETTGRLRIDFYRRIEGNRACGLEILFENGRIKDAHDWTNPGPEATAMEYLAWKTENSVPIVYSAAFAPLTFNTLLMGERSLREIEWAYGETVIKNTATRLLLNALFPKVGQHIDLPFW